jgi:hypothetical protein
MLAAIITQKASEPKKMIDTVDWSAVPCVVAAAGASGWRSFANKARAWTVVPRPNGVELFRITLSTGKKDPGRSRLVFEDTKWSHDAVLMLAHEIEKDRLRPFDLDVVTG